LIRGPDGLNANKVRQLTFCSPAPPVAGRAVLRPARMIQIACLLALPAFGGGDLHAGSVSTYYADFDSYGWSSDYSVFECTLSQQIPGFGAAVFYHQAGEPLTFYLQSADSPFEPGRALLTSQPPVWRQDLPVKDLAYVDVTRGRRPLTLNAAQSRLVLAELSRGMAPTVMRRAWYSAEESIHVGVSPMKFSDVYQSYTQCVSNLLPVNFAQIERSTVFWAPNQRELSAENRSQLDDIIAYLRADSSIRNLEINGFTDGSGNPRDNLELSRIRAFAVQDYLIQGGLNESMLNTRFYGSIAEFRVIRDERSAADRDRNRRVTIRLHR
jgi:outer membrane protein OmpA-like peptidoglycan-associated protein